MYTSGNFRFLAPNGGSFEVANINHWAHNGNWMYIFMATNPATGSPYDAAYVNAILNLAGEPNGKAQLVVQYAAPALCSSYTCAAPLWAASASKTSNVCGWAASDCSSTLCCDPVQNYYCNTHTCPTPLVELADKENALCGQSSSDCSDTKCCTDPAQDFTIQCSDNGATNKPVACTGTNQPSILALKTNCNTQSSTGRVWCYINPTTLITKFGYGGQLRFVTSTGAVIPVDKVSHWAWGGNRIFFYSPLTHTEINALLGPSGGVFPILIQCASGVFDSNTMACVPV